MPQSLELRRINRIIWWWVSEECRLKLSQLDVENQVMHIMCLKNKCCPTTQLLRSEEIRVIKTWFG